MSLGWPWAPQTVNGAVRMDSGKQHGRQDFWEENVSQEKLRSSRGGLASIQVTFLYMDMMVNFMSYLDQAAGSQTVSQTLSAVFL